MEELDEGWGLEEVKRRPAQNETERNNAEGDPEKKNTKNTGFLIMMNGIGGWRWEMKSWRKATLNPDYDQTRP